MGAQTRSEQSSPVFDAELTGEKLRMMASALSFAVVPVAEESAERASPAESPRVAAEAYRVEELQDHLSYVAPAAEGGWFYDAVLRYIFLSERLRHSAHPQAVGLSQRVSETLAAAAVDDLLPPLPYEGRDIGVPPVMYALVKGDAFQQLDMLLAETTQLQGALRTLAARSKAVVEQRRRAAIAAEQARKNKIWNERLGRQWAVYSRYSREVGNAQMAANNAIGERNKWIRRRNDYVKFWNRGSDKATARWYANSGKYYDLRWLLDYTGDKRDYWGRKRDSAERDQEYYTGLRDRAYSEWAKIRNQGPG